MHASSVSSEMAMDIGGRAVAPRRGLHDRRRCSTVDSLPLTGLEPFGRPSGGQVASTYASTGGRSMPETENFRAHRPSVPQTNDVDREARQAAW
jgi:hypothetical protein